jgi:hypothetical protein
MTVWCSLWSFGIPISPVLVCLDQEKFGNPDVSFDVHTMDELKCTETEKWII